MKNEQELIRDYDTLAKAAEQQRDAEAWEKGEGPPPDIQLLRLDGDNRCLTKST